MTLRICPTYEFEIFLGFGAAKEYAPEGLRFADHDASAEFSNVPLIRITERVIKRGGNEFNFAWCSVEQHAVS